MISMTTQLVNGSRNYNGSKALPQVVSSMTTQGDSYSRNPNQTTQTQAVRFLLTWVEQSPEYADLVRQAQAQSISGRQKSSWKRALRFITGLVFANSKDFHGTAIVPDILEGHSQLTASLVSVSSLLNFFTNNPLLFFAFKDIGGFAWIMTLVTNGLILYFTNGTATAVSARKKSNYTWSNVAIAAMLLMNALQSVVAGVGTELMLNQSGLSLMKAEREIESLIVRVEALEEQTSQEYLDAKERCDRGELQLKQIDRANPLWSSLYVRLYGRWDERDRDWTQLDIERLPLCRQVERLREQNYRTYKIAKANLDKLLLVRNNLGNDLAFLKQEMKLVYQLNFTPDGQLLSGTEAARMALLSSWEKLSKGDLAGWGFPLFFLLLSLGTSGAACILTISHSWRKDTQQSFSDTVLRERDRWLEARRRELMALHQREVEVRISNNGHHSNNKHQINTHLSN